MERPAFTADELTEVLTALSEQAKRDEGLVAGLHALIEERRVPEEEAGSRRARPSRGGGARGCHRRSRRDHSCAAPPALTLWFNRMPRWGYAAGSVAAARSPRTPGDDSRNALTREWAGGSRARPVAGGLHTEGRKRACTRDALGTRPESSQARRGREIGPRRRPAQATSDAILTVAAQALAEHGYAAGRPTGFTSSSPCSTSARRGNVSPSRRSAWPCRAPDGAGRLPCRYG